VWREKSVTLCAFNSISQFGTANVADKDPRFVCFDNGETLHAAVLEHVLDIFKSGARHRECRDIRSHDLRDRDTKRMVLFVIEEWEAVEPNHAICDATFAKAFADCLGDTNNNLQRVSVYSTAGDVDFKALP
jgi:hypothetical protein